MGRHACRPDRRPRPTATFPHSIQAGDLAALLVAATDGLKDLGGLIDAPSGRQRIRSTDGSAHDARRRVALVGDQRCQRPI